MVESIKSVQETIAAIATPPGRGGIGIIRVSGPLVAKIAQQLIGTCPVPRQASFVKILGKDGQILDEGLALYFPAPHSFTGEDVLELQGHGGVVVCDMILKSVLDAGARMARPGEFSERAYLNDKLDLTQAEAIADLIDAGSQRAARAAIRTLEGEFSRQVSQLYTELVSLRVYVESALDFADEEIELLQSGDIAGRLQQVQQRLQQILQTANRGRVLGEGLQIVIAGHTNAGKSSLMNALSGRDSAIVTNIPGTTRDVIREKVVIDGIPVHLHDTAGIREQAEKIEQEGIRRAKETISGADLVLWIHDDTEMLRPEAYADYLEGDFILVRNKIDLTGTAAGSSQENNQLCVAISTSDETGLDELEQQIVKMADSDQRSENDFSARRRHIEALDNARQSLDQAAMRLAEQLQAESGGELLAEELRQAQQALGELTGELTPDDLLGKIFSEFCIGK